MLKVAEADYLTDSDVIFGLKINGDARDYSEGAAYRSYFATDDIMFSVPKLDKRLKNKSEVLALHSTSPNNPPIAISSKFLMTKPIYKVLVGS